MSNYNPTVLRNYAKALYVQAVVEIVIFTSLGLGIGYVVMVAITPQRLAPKPVVVQQPTQPGTIPAAALNTDTYHDQDNPFQYVPIAIGGFLGLLIGIARSYSLKVKAQGVLCQVAIEENTSARMPAKY